MKSDNYIKRGLGKLNHPITHPQAQPYPGEVTINGLSRVKVDQKLYTK
jgi:hypothetical protein